MSRLYVGNFPYQTNESDLRGLFSEYGNIGEVIIIFDKDRRSKGFGFIDVEKSEDAIKGLDGSDYGGRPLRVSIAKEKQKSDSTGPVGARRYDGNK